MATNPLLQQFSQFLNVPLTIQNPSTSYAMIGDSRAGYYGGTWRTGVVDLAKPWVTNLMGVRSLFGTGPGQARGMFPGRDNTTWLDPGQSINLVTGKLSNDISKTTAQKLNAGVAMRRANEQGMVADNRSIVQSAQYSLAMLDGMYFGNPRTQDPINSSPLSSQAAANADQGGGRATILGANKASLNYKLDAYQERNPNAGKSETVLPGSMGTYTTVSRDRLLTEMLDKNKETKAKRYSSPRAIT